MGFQRKGDKLETLE